MLRDAHGDAGMDISDFEDHDFQFIRMTTIVLPRSLSTAMPRTQHAACGEECDY